MTAKWIEFSCLLKKKSIESVRFYIFFIINIGNIMLNDSLRFKLWQTIFEKYPFCHSQVNFRHSLSLLVFPRIIFNIFQQNYNVCSLLTTSVFIFPTVTSQMTLCKWLVTRPKSKKIEVWKFWRNFISRYFPLAYVNVSTNIRRICRIFRLENNVIK